ncbi:SPOR domain-containing protein [Aliikangiella sp. IMCC44359]|uniref:SPOR domain-containing protein n=1 Tax=Aliikangiella sp. IMCC44359 TaxID=3459125 RepID=UPI00403AB518
MENSLKQRIVGAIVLIALAVIFLPAILKEKTKRPPFESQIPEKPTSLVEYEISEGTIKKNKLVEQQLNKLEGKANKIDELKQDPEEALAITEDGEENNAETAIIAASSDSESRKTKSQPSTKVELSQQKKQVVEETIGKPFKQAGWVIQVASFSNIENAKNLVKKLKKAGYKAYRRKYKSDKGKVVYRIYVGPYIEKSQASEQLAKVSETAQGKAIIKVFDPIKH